MTSDLFKREHLCRRRRFSSDLLEPITETEFEGLRASIQESKGRLVSLEARFEAKANGPKAMP
ncbi:BQ5605_C003g02112 [Microbotryum silenes-dioicae]|uniref:BQ5605_C003g02112 protein n=1 Tax=Microbotryum silenes-dioicae TaxID=796604 RepID=A0A2X0M510_9BASI|nr:BQ5605_C003g02112 [Microbotryum silenes-dioicae]